MKNTLHKFRMYRTAQKLIVTGLCCFVLNITAIAQQLRVVVAGLNHDHIHNVLHAFNEGRVNIVGIAEPNKQLWHKFGKQYHLPDSLFFTDLKNLIVLKKPNAVLGYNEVGNHLKIVQICAPLHIPVMVEKPLAATLQQALEIEKLANLYHIKVLTNFETTWYSSYADVYHTVTMDSIGSIKKMVVHDGH
jgi:predicted dehydrogenase